PSQATYRPGTIGANQLLKLVDNLLSQSGKLPKFKLQEYLNVLEYTAIQQLFALDIAQQLCRSLLARYNGVAQLIQKAGDSSEVHFDALSFVDPFNASLLSLVGDEDAVMADKKDLIGDALLKLV
ncbi:hypothetical protein H0H93_015689, partial [Arthromyces matolae]